LKQAKKEVRVIEESDDEENNPPQPQIEHNKLNEEIKELREKLDKLRDIRAERNKYQELWFDTLSEKEQKQEEERWLKEQEKKKQEKERKEQKEKAILSKDKPPAPVKSIISIIDDSDEENDLDEEVKTVRIKDNKIMKALESDCEFLD
jgi:hypothetical protein